MIRIEDCEAFCDANPDWVRELACRECLTMVQAYAHAHEMTVCANELQMDAPATPSPDRLAA